MTEISQEKSKTVRKSKIKTQSTCLPMKEPKVQQRKRSFWELM